MAISNEKKALAEQLKQAICLLLNTQVQTATMTDDEIVSVAGVFPKWQAGVHYTMGQIISYGINSLGDPQLYKVISSHTSQSDWTPDTAASLFDAFGLDESGYVIWSQPAGAHDAYAKGDIVNYNGELYESTIDGNVWAPDIYPDGWKKVEPGGGEEGEPPDPTDYPDWVQPTGAHDAYNTGDIIKYNGQLYVSKMDGNVYSPDTYPAGWELYTEEEA